jgi:hypothetical protein
MLMNHRLSDCCSAPVRLATTMFGTTVDDALSNRVTNYFVCYVCREACDTHAGPVPAVDGGGPAASGPPSCTRSGAA